MANLRLFFPLLQVGFAKDGTTNYIEAHGVQSVGITTNFNLQAYFELGQSAIYQIIEELPDVQVNMEKVYDGRPMLYHLATNGATDGSLFGRSNIKTTIAMSLFSDNPGISATGTPIKEVSMSGMYLNSWATAIPVQGLATETITCIGQNKIWRDDVQLGSSVFDGRFNNLDTPGNLNAASGQGLQRRQNVVMTPPTGVFPTDKNGASIGPFSVFPTEIPGITASGVNPTNADGAFTAPFQNASVSVDFGRTPVYELGRKSVYARFVSPVIEVRTELEVLSREGDNISASELGGQNGAGLGLNLNTQTIRIAFQDGTLIDLGPDNKLLTVAQSGGDATQGGSNVTDRYSYQTYNYLKVYSPVDPGGLS